MDDNYTYIQFLRLYKGRFRGCIQAGLEVVYRQVYRLYTDKFRGCIQADLEGVYRQVKRTGLKFIQADLEDVYTTGRFGDYIQTGLEVVYRQG